MSNIFFTSDTHFGHGNIIKYSHRPFLNPTDQAMLDSLGGSWHNGTWKSGDRPQYKISPESTKLMDDALIDGINQVVGRDDTLYHLGDFHFAHIGNYCLVAQTYRERIRCRNVHLIWGNHDNRQAVYPLNRFANMGDLFSSANDLSEIRVGEQRIVLCHYCMNTWNKSHRGSWHLYGHSHGEAETKLDSVFPGRRSMDVGVDNAKRLLGEYRPFSFEEIRGFLKDRPGSFIDHHVDPNTPEE